MSTAPEFRSELTGEILPSIFGELVDLGEEIVRDGLAEEYGNSG